MDVQTINTATLGAIPSAQTPVRNPSATPSTAKASDSQTVASREQLQSSINAVNGFVKSINSEVEFSLDKDSGEMIVKVMDTSTNEVIRQMPSEEMLAVAKALDKFQGLLIKQKA